MMKDHEIVKVVNDLRAIAIRYHSSQQLREQIANVIVPILTAPAVDTKTAALCGVAYVVLGALVAEGIDIPEKYLDAFSDPDSVENPLDLLPFVPAAPAVEKEASGEAEFKNFHRLLCQRFGYVHDDIDWKRDQLSLIEHIATHCDSAGDPVAWRWRLTEEINGMWGPGPWEFTRQPENFTESYYEIEPLYAALHVQTADEEHRNKLMDEIVSLRTEVGTLKSRLAQTADVRAMTDEEIINRFYAHTVMDDEPLFTFDRKSALELARALLEQKK